MLGSLQGPKSSVGLSERNLHTAEALPGRVAQPTPARGKTLGDAPAGGATLSARDGTDCLPTSLRFILGGSTAAALSGGTAGSKEKRFGSFLASKTHLGGTGGDTGKIHFVFGMLLCLCF